MLSITFTYSSREDERRQEEWQHLCFCTVMYSQLDLQEL